MIICGDVILDITLEMAKIVCTCTVSLLLLFLGTSTSWNKHYKLVSFIFLSFTFYIMHRHVKAGCQATNTRN